MSMPTPMRTTGSRLVAAVALTLALLPLSGAAQDDVAMLGQLYGTRPPDGYFDLRARDPGAFEFQRGGLARNLRLEVSRISGPGVPRVRSSSQIASLAMPGRREGRVEGTFRFPLVLGYFADQSAPPPFAPATVQQEFFDGPNSRGGTIRDFYTEISRGLVDLRGNTFGWVQSSVTRLETTAGVSALGGRVGLFIYQLLDAVDEGTIDWGLYDNDGPDGIPNSGDDDGFVDVLAVFHPTFGAECGGAGQDDRVWAHKWALSQAYGFIPPGERPAETTFATSTPAAGGGMIRIDDYTIQPVYSCDGVAINEIGVLAHELGHGFGLPDLYCTSFNCPSAGIGRWGLMGTGSWGCGSFDPARPCHMSAWSKAVLGWVDVETLPPDTDHGVQTLDPVETSGRVVRIDAEDGSDEYFLLENRQRIGFDGGLSGTGLLIWQIDPDFIQARWPSNTVNVMSDHLGVWLRQADGRLDLEGGVNRSDAGDPFPGSRLTTVFHAGLAPQSFTHEKRAAGVTLLDIAQEGTTVRFRAVTGYRDVVVGVEGTSTPGVVVVDGEPLPAAGATLRRAPFQAVTLNAAAGESLGEGMRRPFIAWSDDPLASRLRVLFTPLVDTRVTALYGGEEVQITPVLEGGILGVEPGVVSAAPATHLWVPAGTPVSVHAQPTQGFEFLGWLGEWAGRPNPFSVTPMAPLTIGAEFGLTFSSLAVPLAVGSTALDPELTDALDEFGNANGRYDVGDLRAYLRREAGSRAVVVAPATTATAGTGGVR